MLQDTILPSLDITEIMLYLFFAFFFFLVLYLRREDRREGYPLEADSTGRKEDVGVFWVPDPKTFKLPHGGTFSAPNNKRDERPIAARRLAVWPGAPSAPTGDPMKDGVGPAAYAERADVPDLTWHDAPKIVPMRTLPDFAISDKDPDPRGMTVVGADGKAAGSVSDVWVDRTEMLIRYYEVELAAPQTPQSAPAAASPDGAPPAPAAPPTAQRVLLPMPFANVNRRRKQIEVTAILAKHFADVPPTKAADSVTLLEEDKISAYYAGGLLYATPARQESLA